MKDLTLIAWIIWVVSLVFVGILAFKQQYLLALSYFFFLTLTGFLLYMLYKQQRLLNATREDIKKSDEKSVKKEVTDAKTDQTNKLLNTFNAEMKLEEYKIEQEKKYREIAKKILELDNKLNEKFDLLGKSILKLNKKKR